MDLFGKSKETKHNTLFNPAITHYNRGMAHGRAGQHREAIEEFRKALGIRPDFVQACYYIGIVRRDSGDKEGAIESFKEAIRIDPQYAESYCDLGLVYLRMGCGQEAMGALREGIGAITDKEDLLWMYHLLSGICAGCGEWQEAINTLKQIPCTDSDLSRDIHADINRDLGTAYTQLGLWQEAAEVLQKHIGTKPDDEHGQLLLAKAYNQLGRYDEAMEISRHGINHNSHPYGAYMNLGCAYGGRGDSQKEIDTYKAAIGIEPDCTPAYFALGLSYARIGCHEEAIEAFKRCIRIKPDYAEAHFNLGIAYCVLEDKAAALQQYTILQTLDIEQANELFSRIYR
jgi:tetratricopeptide (TPR) repeat protein